MMNIKNTIKTIGPGILFAGAAIGGSHLIQSTRAGANFGMDLLWVVLLINLFKYPFFEYGHRFTAATGLSIIDGYFKLGKTAVWMFLILNVFTSIINGAAVALVTAGLMANLFGLEYSISSLTGVVLVITLILLFIGRYSALDTLMKIMVSILAITTIVSVFVAFGSDVSLTMSESAKPELWDAAGIAFLLALMGWMPAPIEISVWPSLWALERKKQTKYMPKFKEALFDFHLGYVTTTLMAVFFLSLGAFVMFGSGEEFSNSGIIFSEQIVSLYTKTIGEWSKIIIASIVFITMLSTTLTVFDAYPRALTGSLKKLFVNLKIKSQMLNISFGIGMAFFGILIIVFYTSGLKSLLDFATIVSFLAAPVFAIINYKVVTADFMPEEYRPKLWLRILSWSGIIFLVLFSLLFIGTKIV
ncbi:MAG: Nramp family divalent metal transporter [Melioribacteraceae bacterium]|jgi:Mn2+/Fe2+ NRAMP family transporter|nr:Nramp family divalent metal transporter [Melioribacteraceae bacterium]